MFLVAEEHRCVFGQHDLINGSKLQPHDTATPSSLVPHTHARSALAATQIDPTAAVGEHNLAASQYASAQKSTTNSEAARTLKLLEQHHERLARLIKWQHANPVAHRSETVVDEKSTSQPLPSPKSPKPPEEPFNKSQQPAAPSAPLPQRDISSSIASNLASARGIPASRQRRGNPASPASSTQHAEGKLTTPTRRPKLSDYSSRSDSNPLQEKAASATKSPGPPKISQLPQAADQPANPTPSSIDEPFNRFYSTFESLFTKLSAPLAFAGLPLGIDDTPNSEPAPSSPRKATTQKEKIKDDPDYTRAFSRAAIRALHEERGLTTAAESFYVVPTTGGTISYADILARTKREAARGLGVPEPTDAENPDDEFVDARETPQPPSPAASRKGGKPPGSKGGSTKNMEELTLENQAIRDLLDVLSKRLAQFEMGSQSQSMALHQSLRMMHQSQALPPLPTAGGGVSRGGANEERLAALEEQLTAAQKEMERMGRENEKLKGVVGRYRERWEKLKEGARTRREGTGVGTGGEG
ncbi:MAG: hypothetical protein Q9195_004911 [Heterodermia aff. obscurata]